MTSNVLVVGSGAREHVLCWKLSQSVGLGELYCAPGNAGTSILATNLAYEETDFNGLIAAVDERNIDLVIVGPEAPLAAGLADALRAENTPVFGPDREAARIESSKAWAKSLMEQASIPTGKAQVVSTLEDAESVIHGMSEPLVVKADGLAAGKGVFICQEREEARDVCLSLLQSGILGDAGRTVLIEEFLTGMEVSVLAVTDGTNVVPLLPACDYKRVGEGDTGPNTGGMGAYAPPGAVNRELVDEITRRIIEPAIEAMRMEGLTYRGVIYAGLILTDAGPKVLEFNCRFGDPEAQVVLPMLKSDLLDLCMRAAAGDLADVQTLEWHEGGCVGVVLASEGYPGSYERGKSSAV